MDTTIVNLMSREERKKFEDEFVNDLESIRDAAKIVNEKWLAADMHDNLMAVMTQSDNDFVEKVGTLFDDIDKLVAMKL